MIVGIRKKGSEVLPVNEAIRHKVMALEEVINKEFGGNENVDDVAPVNHYHCKGNYAREVFIPAGTCVVGKIHKHEHINVLSKGRCLVVTEAGREVLEAPLTFISSAGIKRAVYAYTDTVWTTVHPTESSDLEEIEDEVIAKSYDDLNLCLEDIK